MLSVRLLCVSVSVLTVGLAPAMTSRAEALKLGGSFEFDLISEKRETEIEKEAKFEVETKRQDGLKASADLKVSSDSGGLELRELYFDYQVDGGLRWTLGQAKKRFGLESDLGSDDRLTLSHGTLYRKLGGLSYVGRNTMVGLALGEGSQSDAPAFAHDLAFHTSEGMNAALLYKLKARIGEAVFLTSYSLVQANLFYRRWRPSQAQALALSGRWGSLRVESEAFIGRDFILSELKSLSATPGESGKDVLFSAASLGGSWRFSDFEPFARQSMLFHDIESLSDRTLETALGSRFFLTPRLMLGSELTWVRSTISGVRLPDQASSTQLLLTARHSL